MNLNTLTKHAKANDCTVREAELRNGNNPFCGQVALFVHSISNGRSTHFVGFPDNSSRNVQAANWISKNGATK